MARRVWMWLVPFADPSAAIIHVHVLQVQTTIGHVRRPESEIDARGDRGNSGDQDVRLGGVL